MSSNSLYPVPQSTCARTLLDNDGYISMYQASIDNPDRFWKEQASRIHWFSQFTRVKNITFEPDNVSIRWYEEGKTNAAFNCLDRHLASRKRSGRHLLGRRSAWSRAKNYLSGTL